MPPIVSPRADCGLGPRARSGARTAPHGATFRAFIDYNEQPAPTARFGAPRHGVAASRSGPSAFTAAARTARRHAPRGAPPDSPPTTTAGATHPRTHRARIAARKATGADHAIPVSQGGRRGPPDALDGAPGMSKSGR